MNLRDAITLAPLMAFKSTKEKKLETLVD